MRQSWRGQCFGITEPTRLDVIGKKLQTRDEKAEILVNKSEQELQGDWLHQGQI